MDLNALLISVTLGFSYILGAILYRIAPEEVNPFLVKHKIFKVMAKKITYQALILGILFGIILTRYEKIVATFALMIFLYALITTSIASYRLSLNKAIKHAVLPAVIFSLTAWIVSMIV